MSTERAPAHPLAAAIATAITLLGDLRRPAPEVTSGRLAQRLQTVLDQHTSTPGPSTGPHTATAGAGAGPGPTALAAVRTACAHLRTGALDDAYLALLTARDHLPAPAPDHH